MKVLLIGVPLRIRARLQGELPELELVQGRSQEDLFSNLAQPGIVALVIQESVLNEPVTSVLERVSARFKGSILLVTHQLHSGEQLRELVRSYHVSKILQDPANPEDVVRALASDLGLRIEPEGDSQPEDPALDQLWMQNRPQLELWIDKIGEYAESESPLDTLPEARRAAHFLASNFGTFGLPRGTLLAKEASRLLDDVGDDGFCLQSDRLAMAVRALWDLFDSQETLDEKPRRQLILLCDDRELLDSIELEARLQHWEVVVCSEFSEIAPRIRGARVGVLMLDSNASACRDNQQLLQEIADDPFPTVILNADAGTTSPTNTSLERGTSPYRCMMAALRSQLTPALDNPPAILVVDDDPITLDVVQSTLTQVDFHVETLDNPLEFWDTIESVQPNMVVLDIDLPHLSGIEICRAMRMDERYCTIPVIFLSGYGDTKTVQQAFAAGADDFIVKPITPADLRIRVSNRLERCNQRMNRVRQLPSARTFTSLEQLLLRSLREGVSLTLATIVLPESADQAQELARFLRVSLRGEDLVRPLPNQIVMAGCLSNSSEQLSQRIRTLAEKFSGAQVGFATFPDEGDDPQTLLELAFERIPKASSAING